MYPSRYSNGKSVSSAQYITELICEHKAKKDKLDLHYRFWLNKKWSAYYRNQICTANKLLKTYSAKAIIKALNDTRAEKIYSLRAPHLLPIIDEYQTTETNQTTVDNIDPINRSNNIMFGRNNKINNIVSKLRNIDDEK